MVRGRRTGGTGHEGHSGLARELAARYNGLRVEWRR